MIKPGVVHGLKEQDNFLTLYIAAIDNEKKSYQAEGFSYTILLPGFVQILDAEKNGLTISKTTLEGQAYQKIERSLDAKKGASSLPESCLWHRSNFVVSSG